MTMPPVLTPKAALLLSAISITMIDGEADPNEVAIINRLDGFNLSDDWDTAIQVWNEASIEDCISAIASSLDAKQQRVVMANLVDIALADGFLDKVENTLLRVYARAFSVSEEDIERIVDVLSIKNDKSRF